MTVALVATVGQGGGAPRGLRRHFSLARALSYTLREGLELRRDPVRMAMALFGSLILMLIMGYGITMDVNDLSYAVLDRDQTVLSQNYTLNLSGSRYEIFRRSYLTCVQCKRRNESSLQHRRFNDFE